VQIMIKNFVENVFVRYEAIYYFNVISI